MCLLWRWWMTNVHNNCAIMILSWLNEMKKKEEKLSLCHNRLTIYVQIKIFFTSFFFGVDEEWETTLRCFKDAWQIEFFCLLVFFWEEESVVSEKLVCFGGSEVVWSSWLISSWFLCLYICDFKSSIVRRWEKWNN